MIEIEYGIYGIEVMKAKKYSTHREDGFFLVCRDRQIVTSDYYRFRTKDNIYIVVQTIFEPFVNPWNDELEIIVGRNKTKFDRDCSSCLLLQYSDGFF